MNEDAVQKTYSVDSGNAAAADDDSHGTPDAPFKTIGYACERAVRDKEQGIGAKVSVADGVYREAVAIRAPKGGADTDAPLVIEAANREQAVIDGADAAGWESSTWTHDGANWTHPWPGGHGVSPEVRGAAAKPPSDIGHRSELVFVNGVALREVATAADLAPGTFTVAVDRTARRIATGPVTLQLPAETAMDGAAIEVSARDHGLAVYGRRNVAIRGLTIQHVTGYPESEAPNGLLLKGCSNVVIEDVLSQWNNAGGLAFVGRASAPFSAGLTLRRLRLVNNGLAGLSVSLVKNLLVEDCETSFNNFRGDWCGWIDSLTAGGCKVSGVHGGTWRRDRAIGNWCRGLWWDTDDSDITVEDCIVRDNLISGLLIENSDGPFAIHRCVVSGTKTHPSVRDEIGYPAAVSFSTTPDIALVSNIVASNDVPALGLWDVPQRSDGANFETGAKATRRLERHTYRHNVFSGLDASEMLEDLPVADRSGKVPFEPYYGTLISDENCFWNPALAQVFCTYDKTSYHRPGVDLEGWRTFLASRASGGRQPEASSLWKDPLFAEPADGDFRIKSGSPVDDWDLPADEGAAAP